MPKSQVTWRLIMSQSKSWCPAPLGVMISFVLRSNLSWGLLSGESTLCSLLDILVFVAEYYVYSFMYMYTVYVVTGYLYFCVQFILGPDSPAFVGQIFYTAAPLQRHPVNAEGPRSRCYRRTAALRLIVQPCDEDD
jgi:accessory gene regulator protein AgrB